MVVFGDADAYIVPYKIKNSGLFFGKKTNSFVYFV